MKKTFLHNEIWVLTFGAAFQRANVYKDKVEYETRSSFKCTLKKYIIENILPEYKEPLSEDIHIRNIEAIANYSSQWSEILSNGKLSIGVCQKLLNLILKYYWCMGDIPTPPHCPVDRIIQVKGLKSKNIINWTTMSEIEVYLNIINKVRREADKVGLSIAEWELEIFERNNQ